MKSTYLRVIGLVVLI